MQKRSISSLSLFLFFIAGSACERLPLSIGQGLDDMWREPGDSSGAGGTSAVAGAGGSSWGVEHCDTTYVLCLESGEDPIICRDGLARCEQQSTVAGAGGGGDPGSGVAGAAGSGSGGAAGLGGCDGLYQQCLESGDVPAACRERFLLCEDAGGAAGSGSGGASGAPGSGECEATYILCLESGEEPSVCRDAFVRCEEASGGAAGTGAGGAAGARG